MSTNPHGPASDVIPPPLFSEHELREQWNAQADVDELNHWDNLGIDEQLAWAQTRVIAADRAQGAPRDMPPPPAIGTIPTPAAAEPLWRVMMRAYNNAPELPDGIEDRQMYAAEIVAARNWLVPEDGPRPGISWPMERAAWDARQSIRATLTTEADRAERGE